MELFETFACNRSADINSISNAVDNNKSRNKSTDLIAEHLTYFKERYFNDGTPKEIFEGLKFRPGQTDQAAKKKVTETLTNKVDNPLKT